ncbi:MAG: nuclease, partial [Hungatella sp.]|nr:nuclease [Hungatella sp.]
MEIRKQKGKQVGRLTVTEQIHQKHQEDIQRIRC